MSTASAHQTLLAVLPSALAVAAALVMALALALAFWAGWALGQQRKTAQLDPKLRALQRELAAWQRLHAGEQLWWLDAELRVSRLECPLRHEAKPQLPSPTLGAKATEWLEASELPTLTQRLATRGEVIGCAVQWRGDAAAPPGTGSANAVPLHDELGRFIGYLLVLSDAAAPATASSSASATAAATALAAEDALAFSYTVSHDLRAPVRVVDGFARILKEDHGGQLDRVGNDHLDRVLSAAARMNQMIDALLAMARLATQPLARQPVDLSQLAGFVIDELRRGTPERAIEVQLQSGLTALGDPTLLRQVLENLLGNAWKYTQRVNEPRISLTQEVVDGQHCLVVRDNGAGFDMRGAERLFGLFQRLHSASDFPGTGVGLASVKRIVARHGGRIWAHGEPGRGAAFSFTLGS